MPIRRERPTSVSEGVFFQLSHFVRGYQHKRFNVEFQISEEGGKATRHKHTPQYQSEEYSGDD